MQDAALQYLQASFSKVFRSRNTAQRFTDELFYHTKRNGEIEEIDFLVLEITLQIIANPFKSEKFDRISMLKIRGKVDV